MMETREQMEARHAREIAEWEAREALERDPWKDAIDAYWKELGVKPNEIKRADTRKGIIAAAPLMPVQAMGEDAAKALDQAGQWFGEYAISHAAKGATEKAHRNAERAQFCFDAALRAHMTAAGADQ
jgi:hypothetical protein